MNTLNSEPSITYWPGTNQILKPVREVAKILGVHPNTVFRWIKSGRLETVRIGKSIHFTYNQIINFLNNNTHQVKVNTLERRLT